MLVPLKLTAHPNDSIMYSELPGTHSGQEAFHLHYGPKQAKLYEHIGQVKLSGLEMNRMRRYDEKLVMAAASVVDTGQQRSLVLNDGFTIAFIVFCTASTTTGPTDLHLYLSQAMLNLEKEFQYIS
jgi:hypothetical protein